MVTRAILTLALLLPIAAQAEDMFRWRDAKGRVHYSNDTEKVPAGAQVVAKKLGEIGGAPIGEAVPAPTGEAKTMEQWPPASSCVRDLGLLALPHRSVDLDRRHWFYVDYLCGRQHDLEGWLRDATTTLELRKIGL
jgi:uncharacterized protein DUF4124